MQAQVKLGRVFGISIGLHYSWIIIAILIVFSLGEQFHLVHRDWSEGVLWGTAVLTGLLFFVCILLHELGHSVVAQSRGIRLVGNDLGAAKVPYRVGAGAKSDAVVRTELYH